MSRHLVNNNVERNRSEFKHFLRFLLYFHIHECVRHILKRSRQTIRTLVLDFAIKSRVENQKMIIQEVENILIHRPICHEA